MLDRVKDANATVAESPMNVKRPQVRSVKKVRNIPHWSMPGLDLSSYTPQGCICTGNYVTTCRSVPTD